MATDTIEAFITRACADHAARPALTPDVGPAISYAALGHTISRIERDVRALGIARDDRVGLVLPHQATAAALAVALACSAVCVPLRPGMPADELDALLPRLGLRALVLPERLADRARAAAENRATPVLTAAADPATGSLSLAGAPAGPPAPGRAAAPGDLCLIHLTSGVTGGPKLVPRTQRNAIGAPIFGVRRQAWDGDSRALLPIPLSHLFGMKFLLSTLVLGVELILPSDLSPAALLACAGRHRPACIPMSPALLSAVLSALPEGRSNPGGALRAIMIGSAASDSALLAAAAARLDARLIHTYGSSESGLVSIDLPGQPSRPGASGVAVAEVRIVGSAGEDLPPGEEGEILARGPEVFPGYLDDPAATADAFAPGGWFRTGDAGRLDPDGYLFVTGRLDDRINRGGQKVDPREVEAVLLAHPAIAECAVFAVRHPSLGAEVAAAIVLAPGASLDAAAVRRWTLDRLSRHMTPRRIAFVDDLPRTPTGKIRRAALPDLLEAEPRR
ncbi:MAG: class I adenylate-forming enzyme family protein [Chloroflexota bacterium]